MLFFLLKVHFLSKYTSNPFFCAIRAPFTLLQCVKVALFEEFLRSPTACREEKIGIGIRMLQLSKLEYSASDNRKGLIQTYLIKVSKELTKSLFSASLSYLLTSNR